MKFGPIHPTKDTYNFTASDQVIQFAQLNKMAVRGHTLVWHSQNPSWLTDGGFSLPQLMQIMQDHITTVMQKYAGKVYAWDVINEPFNDDGTYRQSVWTGTGANASAGYIETALKTARAADPNALLFINDFNVETTGTKADALYRVAQDFRGRGVPLDGVGLQAHLTVSFNNYAGLDANIKRFTDLGLQVHITELDVRLAVDANGNPSISDQLIQSQIYENVIKTCLKYPLCNSIQVWGVTDKYSWIPGAFTGFGSALPLDANYTPKQAYTERKSTRLNSSHIPLSRMPSSA